MARFKFGETVRICRDCDNIPVRYRGRLVTIDHQFKDGRVLVQATDRVQKLGVLSTDLIRL